MQYKFYQKCEDDDYEFSLEFEKDKCVGIVNFNFPKSRKWSAVLARIVEFIDFNSLHNTVNQLKSINFILEQKKNYVKLYCDIYLMFFKTTYKVPAKESAMLHTCLSCNESEATKLFNYFFVCQEYWATPKTIAVFCKYINEIRRLMTTHKSSEPTKIATTSRLNTEKVVYVTDLTEMSLQDFEERFKNFNRNNPKPMTKDEFINRFGFTVLKDKVLLPPKK